MLRIPRNLADEIIRHAHEGFPLEVCGILAGKNGAITNLYRMVNTDRSNEHFMMDPREQFTVVKEIRKEGLEMMAIYHSHPESPARPSAEDIRLALTPDVSYLIVSLIKPDEPDLKSYLISSGLVEPENLEYL